MTAHHGGQLHRVAARLGIAPDRLTPANLLDFSANINPAGPPPSVVQALRRSLDDPHALTRYPDLDLHALRSALATHTRAPAASIAVSNGMVPLLEATLRTRHLKRCLLPVPCFTEYRATLQRCGVEAVPFPLAPPHFPQRAGELLRAIHHAHADSILLANPQNPTAILTPPGDLLQLIDSPAPPTVLLDEAFIDYAPKASLTQAAPTRHNLVVFRSLTKFFAMPALRVAYAIQDAPATAALHTNLPPWPVSTPAAEAAIAALNDSAFAAHTLTENRSRRDHLHDQLALHGILCPISAANFLLLALPVPAEPLWRRLVLEHGILLRLCDDFESLPNTYLRAAVRLDQHNQALVDALASVL